MRPSPRNGGSLVPGSASYVRAGPGDRVVHGRPQQYRPLVEDDMG